MTLQPRSTVQKVYLHASDTLQIKTHTHTLSMYGCNYCNILHVCFQN